MQKLFINSNENKGSEVHQAIWLLASEKPYLQFNIDFQICGCNALFVSKFKINKSELLASDLTQLEINKQFVENIRKTRDSGISTFHGNVVFGTGLSEAYLETVFLNVNKENPDESGIFCFILESAIITSETSFAKDFKGMDKGPQGYLFASVSVHSTDGNVIYLSPSIESMLGYTCAELKRMGPLSAVYPEDLPVVRDVIRKLKSGSDFLNSKYRMVHKNGTVIQVASISYILRDASGITNHIVNVSWDLNSQQVIEHALLISEQKYHRLVMDLPVGVSLISASGQLLEANEAMKRIMRIPSRLAIAELNFLRIGIIKRYGISDKFALCIKTKKPLGGEAQLKISRKANEIYLTYSFIPILDHKGNVESVIGYVHDLSKQKKAESDYRENADFLKLVINAIKTPFFVKDEHHKWVMLNNAALEMMGQSRETLIGKSDYDLFPTVQADVFWKYDELVFNSGSSINEEQITWSDGSIHTIVSYKQLYVEKASGKKFIVGTSHDITSYKEIEAELRASEAKYRELFNKASDFILTTDMEGAITNANRTLLNYLKTDLQTITKQNVFDFIQGENIEFAKSITERILAGELENSFELSAYSVDKKLVIYEVKVSLIRLDDEPTGVQCVFSDVTERREARLKLEKYNENLLELNKTKDKFFSIIAHDLRNPFSSMIGFSEMLLEDIDNFTKDEIRDSLKIIYDSAKNTFSLLENLLAWSRLETGHIPFVPTQLELASVVEDVINVHFSLAYRKKIEILNLVKPDVELFADKNMLNTILNNLVMNAIKYNRIGGKINIYARSIITESDAGFVKISVADNGIGMDEETREKLFTANRIISNPGTEREQGTGLGLLITREMVEKHGGKISVESSPDKGSVFSFLIPAFKADAHSTVG